MTESKAMILGCSGLSLTADEEAFFRQEKPWAFILFARNIAELTGVKVILIPAAI